MNEAKFMIIAWCYGRSFSIRCLQYDEKMENAIFLVQEMVLLIHDQTKIATDATRAL